MTIRHTPDREHADVIVVGGGISGMTTAHTLAEAGLSVIVLEAKDRVGGRTHTEPGFAGGTLDHGGMYIGTTHHRSRALGESLGLHAVVARPAGDMVFRVDGEVVHAPDSSYPAAISGVEDLRAKMTEAYGKFDELAERVGPDGPWETDADIALDAQTVATWLEENVPDPVVRRLVTADINILIGADTTETSMLFWILYVAKCEGMHALQVTANHSLWVGGSQQISQRIAERSDVEVLVDAPVSLVEYSDAGVTVHSAVGEFTSSHAVIAVPPSAANAIRFDPPLPLPRRQLQARAPMGREVKVQVRYPSQFWVEEGKSGEIFDLDLGYLSLDATRPGDELATIVAFIGGGDYDRWYALGAEGRKQAMIDSLVAALGPRAAMPCVYHETDWPSVPFTMGAPVTVMPPGLLSVTGTALSAPVGPLRFAGTEAAPMWTGYMEGGVQAGEAAAQSIIAARAESLVEVAS